MEQFMESDRRFYARRAAQEALAAQRAVTAEARARRLVLAATYQARLAELERAGPVTSCG